MRETQEDRPFITLTWAQSIDGKIAAAPGERTQISGVETSGVTHALRAVHDGILVGISTILADNPRLTCRLDDKSESMVTSVFKSADMSYMNKKQLHPIPIILDSGLRTPPTAKFLSINRTRVPIVLTEKKSHYKNGKELSYLHSLQSQSSIHHIDGNSVVSGEKRLNLSQAMKCLKQEGISSVMVEGGSTVLSSFFEMNLWDAAVITIAPTIFGIGLQMPKVMSQSPLAMLQNPSWIQHGNDVILLGSRIENSKKPTTSETITHSNKLNTLMKS